MRFSMWLNQNRRHSRRRARERESSTIDFPTLAIRSLRHQRPPSSSRHDDVQHANGGNTDPSMPLLYGLARGWAWEAVCFRCQSHPHEASTDVVDHRGDNVLHWTVFGHPPEHVVRALCTACPALAAQANRQGLYPLHVACSYRASAAVIQLLLDAHPAAAGPVPGVASALHLLCDYGSTLAALQAVVHTTAGVATVRQEDTVYRRRPLHILNGRKSMRACQVARDAMRDLRRRVRALESTRRNRLNDVEEVEEEIRTLKAQLQEYAEGDVWQKVALLLVTEADDKVLSPEGVVDPARIVQAAVEIADCPPSFQEYAILLYAEHLKARNAEGQLPLHLAAARQGGTALLLDLLQACPAAAQVRNTQGELPLQTLLWNHRDLASSDNRLAWEDGVGALVEAHPAALAELGLPNALYPTIWSRLGSPEALFLAIRAFPGNFGSRFTTTKERM